HLERLVGAPAVRHARHQPDLCMSDHGSATRAVPPRFTRVPGDISCQDGGVGGDCLFCRIVAGEIPADVVASTDNAVAFRDVNPQAPVHVLVVPRQHVADVAELADHAPATVAELVSLGRQVAVDAGPDSYRLVFNTGGDAGQTVFHAHL